MKGKVVLLELTSTNYYWVQEISEAELNQLSAGAGEPRASWGDFCTSTLECTFGTMICCPPET